MCCFSQLRATVVPVPAILLQHLVRLYKRGHGLAYETFSYLLIVMQQATSAISSSLVLGVLQNHVTMLLKSCYHVTETM